MKIVVLQGVPASGKSTWAREFVKGKPEWIIVSKDALREGKGDYWIPAHEHYIKSLEFAAVFYALKENLNVVIDGTNFNPAILDNWKQLSEQFSAELEIKKFPISFEEALKRDTERGLRGGRAVGEAAIRHFFDKYDLYNSSAE